MDINKRIDIYQESHYYELTKREQLKIEANYHIGVISIIFAAIIFFIQKIFLLFPIEPVKGLKFVMYICFFVIFLLSFVFLLISIVYIFKSYHEYEYELMGFPESIEQTYAETQDYYKDFERGSCNKLVGVQYKEIEKPKNMFEIELIEMFDKTIKINRGNNNNRADFLYKSRKFLICSMFMILIIGCIFAGCLVCKGVSTISKNKDEEKPVKEITPIKTTSQRSIIHSDDRKQIYEINSERTEKIEKDKKK